MSLKEQVVQDLDRLPERDLKQVADYMAFLKFRARRRQMPLSEDASLAALYAEFAEEDRELAEDGLAEYVVGLSVEDVR